ncbi:hypothetical protein [Streptomyces sp. A1136]|uniref:hypothetical protein n=1 Tax=Streptomyces sp. A1136 TaxID=2563102 RepID=UPI00109ED02E|nr:hypothetical protein [Streptomyces sp. A1136]THA45149.1 hypothetical protein E6R62_35910 [Streptomyces sp. A1136]
MAVTLRVASGHLYGVALDYIPRRAASDLPFDGSDIVLRYIFEHHALPFEFEDTLEVWSVAILRYHSEDGCSQCPPDASLCRFQDGIPLGEMSFVRIRDYTRDPANAMTPGLHWSPAFEERMEVPAGDLLIMDRVRIEPPWRGFGIGALAAAEAIRRLADGCCAVACEPTPTDGDFENDKPGYPAAQAKIAKVWESVGFEAFHDGIYLLDPALRHPVDCRTKWQKHFGR